MKIVYKPKWVSGRYHKSLNKSKAILYNKLEGLSFLFEDESADIINKLLYYNQDEPIPIDNLLKVEEQTFSKEEIIEFCNELVDAGLLTNYIFTIDDIDNIRSKVVNKRKGETDLTKKTIYEKLPFVTSSAENEYSDFIEKDGIPFSVMIEVTYNCNEKCIHCYNPGAARNDTEKSQRTIFSELSYFDYENLFKELKELGVVKIAITGGEPFIRKDIWKIIELLYENGFAFDIFTNGLLLNNYVNKLANYFPQSVKLSVYSAKEEVHDSITRVKGSLLKTLSTAKKIKEKGIPIYFNCPIMKNNLSSYFTVVELAKDYYALAQFDVNLSDSLDGDVAASQQLQVSNDELEILLRDPNISLYVGKEAPGYGKKNLIKNEPFCGAGINLFNITPEGNVTPCNAFPASFGNLKQKNFIEILNSERLKKWRKITINDYDECGTHEQCFYCNRCPGQSFIEHGDPLKKSTANHKLAMVRKNLADKLKRGIDPLSGRKPTDILKEFSFNSTIVNSINTINYRNNLLDINKNNG